MTRKTIDPVALAKVLGCEPAGNAIDLKALAKQLGRPLGTLEVLENDPFTAGNAPKRKANAEWFATMWQRFNLQPGAHLRRVHYRLISQPSGDVLMPDGQNYVNTLYPCWDHMLSSSLDARYLNLVPASYLVDRRNPEPIIFLPNDATNPELNVVGGLPDNKILQALDIVPKLSVVRPKILQRYHNEVWAEKTTMNDILLPWCQRFGVNLITGSGELSLTACVNVVKRALANGGRPVRIFYVSDFDPGGRGMPVAVARKVEFEIINGGYTHLDIQLKPLVLTLEQCVEYRLPRTPIKDGDKRKGKFEERFGEGATELDALEALYPGELERILTTEIMRYFDAGLDDRVDAVVEQVQGALGDINAEVHERHARDIAKLKLSQRRLVAAFKAYKQETKPLVRKIERDLIAESPDLNRFDWPVPDVGNPDPDPLFDSKRDFIEQTDRYKRHQAKPIARKVQKTTTAVCIICGEEYEKTSRNKRGTCRDADCRNAEYRQRQFAKADQWLAERDAE